MESATFEQNHGKGTHYITGKLVLQYYCEQTSWVTISHYIFLEEKCHEFFIWLLKPVIIPGEFYAN